MDTNDYMNVREEEGVLFENTHLRDRKFFKAFYTFYFFKRPILTALYIVMALSVAVNLISFFLGEKDSLQWTIAPILWFLLVLFLWWRNIKVATARQKESGNGEVIVYTIKIFEDRILYKTSLGTTMIFEIAGIKRIDCTKSYLLLRTTAYQIIPIEKDCFTKGTYEEFCDFLRTKGYKVKG